mmetsp:Transcript_10618/g.36706  ORF Transcript_10618/g.36706 Transcript_10618/m.36706 type:complete len:212 (-) Transcript_10618:47-682(-)
MDFSPTPKVFLGFDSFADVVSLDLRERPFFSFRGDLGPGTSAFAALASFASCFSGLPRATETSPSSPPAPFFRRLNLGSPAPAFAEAFSFSPASLSRLAAFTLDLAAAPPPKKQSIRFFCCMLAVPCPTKIPDPPPRRAHGAFVARCKPARRRGDPQTPSVPPRSRASATSRGNRGRKLCKQTLPGSKDPHLVIVTAMVATSRRATPRRCR